MQVLNKYTIENFCARTKEKYVVFASRKVCSKLLLLGKRYAPKIKIKKHTVMRRRAEKLMERMITCYARKEWTLSLECGR